MHLNLEHGYVLLDELAYLEELEGFKILREFVQKQ